MATPAQILANRANAQKSTGPRTAEGKAASRLNALKHGLDAASLILPGEDPAAYEALAAGYRDEFRPRTPSENFHVDTMIRADWSKRRLQLQEPELYRRVLAEAGEGAHIVDAILSGTPAAKLLTRVQRQIVAFERAWYRANTELLRARREAEAAESEAFEAFLDRTCAVPPLPKSASFPQPGEPTSPLEQPELALDDALIFQDEPAPVGRSVELR
jgi:hypothetical protein